MNRFLVAVDVRVNNDREIKSVVELVAGLEYLTSRHYLGSSFASASD